MSLYHCFIFHRPSKRAALPLIRLILFKSFYLHLLSLENLRILLRSQYSWIWMNIDVLGLIKSFTSHLSLSYTFIPTRSQRQSLLSLIEWPFFWWLFRNAKCHCLFCLSLAVWSASSFIIREHSTERIGLYLYRSHLYNDLFLFCYI